jgi:thymidylate synthase (FAD)
MEFDLYGDGIGKVALIEHWGSDLKVVNSARHSYGNQVTEMSAKDERLIEFLMEHRHTTPFETPGATFFFKVPLYVARQHQRHRTWSYNELSRRFTSKNIEFYEPATFRAQHSKNHQGSVLDSAFDPMVELPQWGTQIWLSASAAIKKSHILQLELYENLLQANICREQARGVLPQNMYTEYYGTSNLHNLIKFISLRLPDNAQWEMKRVAECLLEILREKYPVSIRAFEKYGLSHLPAKDENDTR